MDYKLKTLHNKVQVLAVPLPNLKSVTLTVWLKVGSRYEVAGQSGISHFLEHMAFKGSKKYPTSQIVSRTIDAMGAESNASTSHELTRYYIKTRSSNLQKAFDIVADLLTSPKFDPVEIEKERQVILEEIAMYEDTPYEKVGDIFGELIFAGNPLARDVAGTPKTVKSFGQSDFVAYKNKFYHANNLVISAAGGVTAKQVRSLSNKYFGNFDEGKHVEPVLFDDKQKKPKLKIKYKKSKQAHLILGFISYPRAHKARFAQSLMTTILGSGRSSRLFDEVREKRGLAYAVNSGFARYVDTGYFATYAGVAPSKVEEAIKVIMDEHWGLANKIKKVTEDELTKAKEYMKGRMALSLEDTASVDSFYASQVLFEKEILKPDEIFKRIDAVTDEQIYKVAKETFVPNKVNLAVIGPYKDKAKFEKLIA